MPYIYVGHTQKKSKQLLSGEDESTAGHVCPLGLSDSKAVDLPHDGHSHHVINLLLLCLPTTAAEPLPLMDLCRRAARLALGRERLQEIQSLPLPQSLKNYLQYQ